MFLDAPNLVNVNNAVYDNVTGLTTITTTNIDHGLYCWYGCKFGEISFLL